MNMPCMSRPTRLGIHCKNLSNMLKRIPGKVIYGSVGVGTTNHIILARLAKEHSLNMKHVPYKGDGEIIPAMLGGHVHVASGSPAAVVPQVKAGNSNSWW